MRPKQFICRICMHYRTQGSYKVCYKCLPDWKELNRNKRYTKEALCQAYDILVQEAGECCRICGFKPQGRRLTVDYDIFTKVVRGLLCSRCNRGLKWFHNDPIKLRSAIEYLEEKKHLKVAPL